MVSWALVVFWVFSIYLYFVQGCMKALGNEEFLNACVSLTTFLYELYMHQHNNLNKSNERHQLIRWLGIVLGMLGDVWRHWGINSVLIPVCLQEHSCMKLYIYEQNNVNKANKSHQLIRYGLEYLLIYGRMSESIEQRTVFGYLCLFKNSVINYEVIRLSTQQCKQM